MNRKIWILWVLFFWGIYQFVQDREISQPPGILAPDEPLQRANASTTPSIVVDGAILDPLAAYNIRARVLAKRRYWFDRLASLAPYDFALGWGPMSDSNILKFIEMSQADRFYFFHWRTLPVEPEIISLHSANVHLLPSDSLIKRKLDDVHVGQVIQLQGQLVRINYRDGSEVVSSLSRSDTGAGACEVMWVTGIR